jgi:hypothetical protein
MRSQIINHLENVKQGILNLNQNRINGFYDVIFLSLMKLAC